jgi:hypothetical protein
MLGPVTLQEICAVAHKFHLTNLETHKKLEVMENSHYMAKITRTRSKLQVIGVLKDNTQAKYLTLEFSKQLKDFKNKALTLS